MINRICHLCGQTYNEDPLSAEQPAHTPTCCISNLEFRCRELETKLSKAEEQLKRARLEYKNRTSTSS